MSGGGGGAYWNRPTQDTDLRGLYDGRPGAEAPSRQFNERPTAYHHLVGRERAVEVDRLHTEGFVRDNDMRPGVDPPLVSRPRPDGEGILRVTVDNDRYRRGHDVPPGSGYTDVVSQQLSILRHSTDTQGGMPPPSVTGATSYRPPEASGAMLNRAKVQSDTDWRMPPSSQSKEPSVTSQVSSSMEKASDILARLESWKKISMRSQEALKKPIYGSTTNAPQPRLDVTASAQEKLLKNINMIVETFGSGSAGNKPSIVSLPDNFVAPLSATISVSSTAGSFPTNPSTFSRLTSALEVQQSQTLSGMNSTQPLSGMNSTATAAAATAATARQPSPLRPKPEDRVFSLKYRQPPTSTPQTSTVAAPTCDPIFADVLKSIGFNFDFSRFGKQEPEQPKPQVSVIPVTSVPVSVSQVQMPPIQQIAPTQFATMPNVVSNPPFVPVGIHPLPFPVAGMPPPQSYAYPNPVQMAYPPPAIHPPFNVGPPPATENRTYDIRITKEFGSEKKRKVEVRKMSRDPSSDSVRSRSLSPSEWRDSNKTRKSPKSMKRRSPVRQKSKGNGKSRPMEERNRRSCSRGESLPRRSRTKDQSRKRADSSPRRQREGSSSMGSRRRERSPRSPISIQSSTSSASFSPHRKRRSLRGMRLSRERSASPPKVQPPIGFPEPGYYMGPPPYGPPPGPMQPLGPPPYGPPPPGPMQPLLPPWLTPRDPRQHPAFRTQNAEEEDWKRSTEEFLQRMNRPSRSTVAQPPREPISLPVRPVSPSILSNCSSVSSGSMESLLDDGNVTKSDGSGKVSKLASFLAEQQKKIEDLERELSKLKGAKNTSDGDTDSSAAESKRTETQVESEITALRGSMEEEKKKAEERKKEKTSNKRSTTDRSAAGVATKCSSSKGTNRVKGAKKTSPELDAKSSSKVEASSDAAGRKRKDQKSKDLKDVSKDKLPDKQLTKGAVTADKAADVASQMSAGNEGKESVPADKDATSASESSAVNNTQDSSSGKKESTVNKVGDVVDKGVVDKVKSAPDNSAPTASKGGKDSAKDRTPGTETQKKSSRGNSREKSAAAASDKKVASSDSDRHLHQTEKKKLDSRKDSRSHKSAERSSSKAEASTETSRRHGKDDERKDHDRHDRSDKDRSDKDRSSKSVNRSRSQSRGKDRDRDVVGYKDDGGHWCGVCSCEFDTISDFLSHLESSPTHKQLAVKQQSAKSKLDTTVKPVDKSKHGRMENVKGSEFMVTVMEPFYCKLCSLFIGDISQATAHLQGAEHNTEYKNYVKRHSSYEREFDRMQSKIRDRKSSATTRRRSGNHEESTDNKKKSKRSSSPAADKKKLEDKKDRSKSSPVVEKDSGEKAADGIVDTSKSASESVSKNNASELSSQKSDSKEEGAMENVESKGEMEVVASSEKQEVVEQEPVTSVDSSVPLNVSITNYMSDISSRDSMSPVSDDGIDLGPINLVFVNGSGGGSGSGRVTMMQNVLPTVSESVNSGTDSMEVVSLEATVDLNSSSEVAPVNQAADDVMIVEMPVPPPVVVELMDDDTAEYSLPAIEVNSSSDGSCIEVDVKAVGGKVKENDERKFAAVTVTKQEVCDVEMPDEVAEHETTTSAELLGDERKEEGREETKQLDVIEMLSSADNYQEVNKELEGMDLGPEVAETTVTDIGGISRDIENHDGAVTRETTESLLEKECFTVSEDRKEMASSEPVEEHRLADVVAGDGIELPVVGDTLALAGKIEVDDLEEAVATSINDGPDEEIGEKRVESDISATVSDTAVVSGCGIAEKSGMSGEMLSSVDACHSDSKIEAGMIGGKLSNTEMSSTLDSTDEESNEVIWSDEQNTGVDQQCVTGASEKFLTEAGGNEGIMGAEKLKRSENDEDSVLLEAGVSEPVPELIESLIRTDDGYEKDKNEECHHGSPCHSSDSPVPPAASSSAAANSDLHDADVQEVCAKSNERLTSGAEEDMTTTTADTAVDLTGEDAVTEKEGGEEEEDFEIDLL